MDEESPEKRIETLTQFRLRLTASDQLDDAFIRFTEKDLRYKLKPHLFIYSMRWLTLNNLLTPAGGNLTQSRIDQASMLANNEKARKFIIDPSYEHRITIRHTGRGAALRFAVHLGLEATRTVLKPELNWQVPPPELNTGLAARGIALFQYSVPAPVQSLETAANHLQGVLNDKVRIGELSLVDEAYPDQPPSNLAIPIRSSALVPQPAVATESLRDAV